MAPHIAPERQEVDEFVDKRGHKPRERRCVATQESGDPKDMIRFVASPDGVLTPDIKGNLPGRGVYVSAAKEVLETAIKSGGFARGLKSKVSVPENLSDLVEQALMRSVLSLIGMAKKSGQIVQGFDQVQAMARSHAIAWRIEASDGAADGRGKLRTLSKAVARELGQPLPGVIGCFSAAELGRILGRDQVVHAAIGQGKLAQRLAVQARRLAGFKTLIPMEWPDYEHEMRGDTPRQEPS